MPQLVGESALFPNKFGLPDVNLFFFTIHSIYKSHNFPPSLCYILAEIGIGIKVFPKKSV